MKNNLKRIEIKVALFCFFYEFLMSGLIGDSWSLIAASMDTLYIAISHSMYPLESSTVPLWNNDSEKRNNILELL